MMISLFHRVQNTVRKGKNAGYQHFLLFPQCFLKGCLKCDCVAKGEAIKILSIIQSVKPQACSKPVQDTWLHYNCSS